MSLRRTAAIVIAVAALGAGLLVPTGASAADCVRGQTLAEFIQPKGGQVSANTHLGGIAYTLPNSPAPLAVMLSTTGQIQVEIRHACLLSLTLTVFKDGVAAPIHQRTWEPLSCEEATKTDTVNIGLDGGSYRFVLDGTGCDGIKVRSDGQGGLVADPPLGL